MKNRRLVWFVFGALLALLPLFASGGPWDPNRARPPGFQRTLSYLEGDLYNYPDAKLQKTRNDILHSDLTTTLIPQLKSSVPTSAWESEGQKAYDSYAGQYGQVKTIIRQTMTDPEGLIQAVEGNRPLSAELLAHPNAQALILLKWQMLNIAEQTYQALLYARGEPPGSPPGPPTDISPPKPGKGKPGIDLKRMQETRRRAIERRRAFEERAAREAERRQAELNKLIEQLIGRSQSSNKFQSRPSGSYVSSPEADSTPEPTASAPKSEPAPTIEEIQQIEEQIEEAEKQEEAKTEEKGAEKVTVYRGTLILSRMPEWSEDTWQTIKNIFKDALSKPPGTTDMNDKGDEVTWRYKLLQPGGYPLKFPQLRDIPDAQTTEEDAAGDNKPAKPAPKFEGNGPLPSQDKEVDVPGSGTKPGAKPDVKPAPTKPKAESAKTEPPKAKPVPGYWFDPTDNDADADDPIIYVRIDGVATRMSLSEAKNPNVGVPADASVATMTWYNERLGKITKNAKSGTHRGKP